MPEAEHESNTLRMEAIADILAKGVVRMFTPPNSSEKDSPNVSHVGLSSLANDRSL
ncbi:MAG: hypothetical protein AAFV88_06995 [Planctomycetota bacterium]